MFKSYLQLAEITFSASIVIISSLYINGKLNYLIMLLAYYSAIAHLHKDAIASCFPRRS